MLSRSQFVTLFSALGAALAPQAARAAEQPPWYPLPPAIPLSKGRALVLSGAGARGAYEAGVLKWLFRDVQNRAQPFDVICGTSAGAINSAFAAQGTAEAIGQTEQLWKSMPSSNIIQFEPQVQDLVDAAKQMQEAGKHGYPAKFRYINAARLDIKAVGPPETLTTLMSILQDNGIDALVKKYPLSLDALQTSLLVTATNVTELTSDSFYKFIGPQAATHEQHFLARTAPRARLQAAGQAPELGGPASLHHALTPDNFIDAVLASAAVPGVFQPVAVKRVETSDTNLYVDGGVANNTPIGLAVAAGANDITVIMATAQNERPKPPTNLLLLIQATNTIMQRRILESDALLALAQNLLAKRHDWSGLSAPTRSYLEALHERDWKPITLRLIRPRDPLELTMMGFNDQQGIDAAFDQGYSDAQDEWVYTIG